ILRLLLRSPSLLPRPRTSTLFPYTTLFRSGRAIRKTSGVVSCNVFSRSSATSSTRARLRFEADGSGYLRPTPRASSPLGVKATRSEEHTSELQSRVDLVCRLLLDKKNRRQP